MGRGPKTIPTPALTVIVTGAKHVYLFQEWPVEFQWYPIANSVCAVYLLPTDYQPSLTSHSGRFVGDTPFGARNFEISTESLQLNSLDPGLKTCRG